MIVYLIRRECFNHELLPGEYAAFKDDLTAWVVMRCIECHQLSRLMRRNHSVDCWGVVTPACVCLGCKATREIVLLDWIPEAKATA